METAQDPLPFKDIILFEKTDDQESLGFTTPNIPECASFHVNEWKKSIPKVISASLHFGSSLEGARKAAELDERLTQANIEHTVETIAQDAPGRRGEPVGITITDEAAIEKFKKLGGIVLPAQLFQRTIFFQKPDKEEISTNLSVEYFLKYCGIKYRHNEDGSFTISDPTSICATVWIGGTFRGWEAFMKKHGYPLVSPVGLSPHQPGAGVFTAAASVLIERILYQRKNASFSR